MTVLWGNPAAVLQERMTRSGARPAADAAGDEAPKTSAHVKMTARKTGCGMAMPDSNVPPGVSADKRRDWRTVKDRMNRNHRMKALDREPRGLSISN